MPFQCKPPNHSVCRAERMESDQPLSSVNTLKEFINAYHQSIGHHGPHELEPTFIPPSPVKVSCLLVHGKVWNHRDKCLYICDAAAFSRLETALKKVSFLDKGVAWPHVISVSGQPAVEWLMLRNEMRMSSDYSWTPAAKVWFVVSDATQDLLDHVACLLSLVPSRTTVTLHDLRATASTSSSVQVKLAVTMIVMHPEDVIASVSLSSDSECCTVCISEKASFRTSSEAAGLVKAECEHFFITEVPLFLKLAIDQAKESSGIMVSAEIEESLYSEITFKEEPICDVDAVLSYNDTLGSVRQLGMTTIQDTGAVVRAESTVNVTNDDREWIAQYQKRGDVKKQLSCMMRRHSSQKHLGQLLQCPKCPTVFRYGLHGIGLGLLLSHVHKCHQRLISHCRSVIKTQYAAQIADYKKNGRGCVFVSYGTSQGNKGNGEGRKKEINQPVSAGFKAIVK